LSKEETARDWLRYRIENLLPGIALVGGNKTKDGV